MSTPKFLSIPTAYKANKIYSVVPDSGDGDLTFTRASKRTRRNSEGSIEQLATGVPALNYSADETCPKWSFEPTRTNLLPYSNTQDFTVSNATRGAAQTYNNVKGYFYNASGGVEFAARKATNGTELGYKTLSIYVDISKSTYFTILFYIDSSANNVSCQFDTSTKTFGTINENNTYWRNSIVKATQVSGNIYRLELTSELILGGNNLNSYIGANTDVSNIWLGGAQLEKGYGATSLIETNGAQALRITDSATLTNLFTKGLLTATAGAVYLEVLLRDIDIKGTIDSLFIIGAYPDSRFLLLQYNHPTVRVWSADASYNDYILTQENNKIVLNYSSVGVDVWVNGNKVLSTGKAFSLTNETMTLRGQGRQWDLKAIAMWNSTQTDEFCQNLTTL